MPERQAVSVHERYSQWFVSVIAIFVTFLSTANDTAVKLVSTLSLALPVVVAQWLFEGFYQAIATPLTYLAANNLKRWAGVDVYDNDISVNGFLIRE